MGVPRAGVSRVGVVSQCLLFISTAAHLDSFGKSTNFSQSFDGRSKSLGTTWCESSTNNNILNNKQTN